MEKSMYMMMIEKSKTYNKITKKWLRNMLRT